MYQHSLRLPLPLCPTLLPSLEAPLASHGRSKSSSSAVTQPRQAITDGRVWPRADRPSTYGTGRVTGRRPVSLRSPSSWTERCDSSALSQEKVPHHGDGGGGGGGGGERWRGGGVATTTAAAAAASAATAVGLD